MLFAKQDDLNEKVYKVVFAVLFLAVSVLYIWRLKFGYASNDECFCLSVPYRLTLGDRLIIDEWHPSQLWSVILYPLMKIYTCVVSSTDGIILVFRYIFFITHMCVSCVLLHSIKKLSPIAALFTFLAFSLYSPFNINNFAYNICGLWAVVLLFSVGLMEELHQKQLRYVLMGILIAMLVISNPYCVILYIFQLFYSIKSAFRDKETYIKRIIWQHIGIIIVVILFVICLYNGKSPIAFAKDVWHNLPKMLSDGSHNSKGFLGVLVPILNQVKAFYVFWIVYCALFIAGIINKPRRIAFFCGIVLNALAWMIFMLAHEGWFVNNALMAVLAPVGLAAYAFGSKTADNRRLFCMGWLLSFGYAMCMNLSSNQGMYVIEHGLTLASFASLIFIRDYLKGENILISEYSEQAKTKVKKALLRVSLFAVFMVGILQISKEVYNKINYCFWDDDVNMLSYTIESGAQKGIVTGPIKGEQYDMEAKEIRELNISDDYYILFYRMKSDGYMMTDAGFGTMSSFLYEEKSPFSDRIRDWIYLHPEKTPRYIYVDGISALDYFGDEWEEMASENGYSTTEMESGAILMEKN